MKDLLSKRISTFEHVIHIFLSLASGGYWLIIYIIRALAYKQSKQNDESKLKTTSPVIRKPNKSSDLKIGDYPTRLFASEEEADEDEWFEYVEEYLPSALHSHQCGFIAQSVENIDNLKHAVTGGVNK